MERCKGLKGEERKNCVKQATDASQGCKANANDASKQCKANARNEQKICTAGCLNDEDNDGIPDAYDTFTCCLGSHGIDHECFQATIEECRNLGGAVMECIPDIGEDVQPPGELQNYTQTNKTQHSDWVKNLTDAANATGIPNKTYVPGTYDCDDFADDMEKNLTALGYNATYTIYWWNNGANGHVVTDVHGPNGTLIFIEPQTGEVVDLDFDGDGKVETMNNEHKNTFTPTDDNRQVEVFDDAASAAAAGAPRD